MKKRMILSAIIAACTTMCLTMSVYADGEGMNGFGNLPEETEIENAEKNAEKKQQINYSYGQMGLRSYNTEQRYLPVPLFHQEQNWYCGPASVQMISTYLSGTTYSQDDIANYMGTTPSEGTEVSQMMYGVNYWSGTNFYSCEQISNVSIEYAVKSSVNQNYPVIANVLTQELDEHYGFNSGHYVVITGYKYYWSGTPVYAPSALNVSPKGLAYSSTFTYNDPYFPATKTVRTSKMGNAIRRWTGYFIW